MIDNISENPSQNNIILIINSIVLIIMPDLLLSSFKVTITSVTQNILPNISTIFKYKSSILVLGIENAQHNTTLNIKVDIHNVVNISNATKSFLNPNLMINLINPKIEITENKIKFPIILSLSVYNNTIYFFSIYDSIF